MEFISVHPNYDRTVVLEQQMVICSAVQFKGNEKVNCNVVHLF